jgi:hypothetical protein
MKTKAGLLWQPGQDWDIVEAEPADRATGEVQVQLVATSAAH